MSRRPGPEYRTDDDGSTWRKVSGGPAHPAVCVTWRGMSASIDVKLAPLVRIMWRLGIETTGCCQELPGHGRRHPGCAWIGMAAASAARLAAALCDGPGGRDGNARELRRRANGDGPAGSRWYWETLTDIRHVPGALASGAVRYPPECQGAMHPDGERHTAMAAAALEIALYLPPQDIGPLTRHLRNLAAEPGHPAQDAAAGWLAGRLRRGPVPVAEIREMAEAVGISPRTLDRAKAAARVRSVRQGFGPGAVYLWELPG